MPRFLPLGLFQWNEPSCAALFPAAALSPDQLHSVTSVLRNVISHHFTPCLHLRNTTLTQTGSGQQISGYALDWQGLAVQTGSGQQISGSGLAGPGCLPYSGVAARETFVFPDRAKLQFV